VQVLLAGAFSETLSSNKVDEDATVKILEEGGAKQDLAKIIELLHLIRNIRYPDTKSDEEAQSTLDSIKDELWGKTKKLVERESESICGLGDRIASEIKKVGDRVILKADEINALLPIKTRFPL